MEEVRKGAGLSGRGERGRREQWCEDGRSGLKWRFLGGEELVGAWLGSTEGGGLGGLDAGLRSIA